MMRPLTRRRFLTITAAAGAGVGLPLNGAGARQTKWHGTALGANARMIFANAERQAAEGAIRSCRAEITRLERMFSLYDKGSELSRLNHAGGITTPSADFLHLMQLAKWFSSETGGAFDCTVQPVWRHLVDHYAGDTATSSPDLQHLRQTLKAVGSRKLRATPEAVALPQGGAVTLNGIAQGYITDRVADLLQSMGWRDVLVDLGEIRALPGREWPVRVAVSGLRMSIGGGAVATSAGYGTRLNASGDWHHLIDPRSGVSSNHFKAVTVVAARAVTADALSTALAIAAPSEIAVIAAKFPAASIYLQHHNGRVQRL